MNAIFRKSSSVDDENLTSVDVNAEFKFEFDYHHPTGAVGKKKKKRNKKKTTNNVNAIGADDEDNEAVGNPSDNCLDESFSEYDAATVKNITNLISEDVDTSVNTKTATINNIEGKSAANKIKSKQSTSNNTNSSPAAASTTSKTLQPKATANTPSTSSQPVPTKSNKTKSKTKSNNSKLVSTVTIEDDDFDSLLNEFKQQDLLNAPPPPAVITTTSKKSGVTTGFKSTKNNTATSTTPKDTVRFLSPKDPELTETSRLKAKYGKGKNLVAIGPQKIRDPNWLGGNNEGDNNGNVNNKNNNTSKLADSNTSETSNNGNVKDDSVILHSSAFSFSFGGL